jgi:hypothetical protein
MVHEEVVVDPIDVEGHSIAPAVVRHSPLRIGIATQSRVHTPHPNRRARPHRPELPTGFVPRRAIEYRKQARDMRIMRQDNPYRWIKFEGVEGRFWSQFHHDYYVFICLKDGIRGSTSPHVQHKAPSLESLREHDHPEVNALIDKLAKWRLLDLMTIKKNWNTEILN